MEARSRLKRAVRMLPANHLRVAFSFSPFVVWLDGYDHWLIDTALHGREHIEIPRQCPLMWHGPLVPRVRASISFVPEYTEA